MRKSVIVAHAILCMSAISICAQESFMVGTIKLFNPNTDVQMSFSSPGVSNVVRIVGTPRMLIANAYNITRREQVIGGPTWIDETPYVIEAKLTDESWEAIKTLPFAERKTRVSKMLADFLADRFQLKVHIETKTADVYYLVLANNGKSLHKPNSPESADTGGGMVPDMKLGTFTVDNLTLQAIFNVPLTQIDRFVINNTELAGRYSFTLHWVPDFSHNRDAGEPINNAIQKELGLKLVPGKGPVPMVVIDRIARPSEN